MNHTKEPWKYIEQPNSDWCYIVSEVEDAYIGKQRVFDYYGEREQRKVDAQRIVACVNACADVEDDCLDFGYVKWLQRRIVELKLSVMNLEEEIARLKVIDNRLVTNGDWEDV